MHAAAVALGVPANGDVDRERTLPRLARVSLSQTLQNLDREDRRAQQVGLPSVDEGGR